MMANGRTLQHYRNRIRLDSITETRTSLGVNDQRMKNVNPHQAAIQPHLLACLYNKVNTLQSVADCLNSKGLRTARSEAVRASEPTNLFPFPAAFYIDPVHFA